MRIECRATSHVCRLSLGKAGVAATRLRAAQPSLHGEEAAGPPWPIRP